MGSHRYVVVGLSSVCDICEPAAHLDARVLDARVLRLQHG